MAAWRLGRLCALRRLPEYLLAQTLRKAGALVAQLLPLCDARAALASRTPTM